MTPVETKPPDFATSSSGSSSRGPNAKQPPARWPKPLRRWSVAELVARAAVRRPMTT